MGFIFLLCRLIKPHKRSNYICFDLIFCLKCPTPTMLPGTQKHQIIQNRAKAEKSAAHLKFKMPGTKFEATNHLNCRRDSVTFHTFFFFTLPSYSLVCWSRLGLPCFADDVFVSSASLNAASAAAT